MEGTVKFFNNMKGFGFITRADGEKDVYVNRDDIQGGVELKEGDKVTFDVVMESRGPRAKNVTKA